MPLTAEPLTLSLKTPWRIAHGASTTRTTALVRLGDALGEGALPPFFPWRFEAVQAYVEALDADALLRADPLALDATLDALPPGPPPALAALDLALHDRWGRALGHPLYRLWGLSPERAPASTLSFSIPEHPGEIADQIARAPGFTAYKLKLGSGDVDHDAAVVQAARAATDARLLVDANGGWTVEQAAWIIPRLGELGVVLVEQPLPAGAQEAWHTLRRRLPAEAPPLFADESVQTAADVLALSGALGGINVKIAKCGGIRAVRRLIVLARALGLGVMLGCMIESSIALTAAAHLAPLADFIDLDGTIHLADDPFEGMRLTDAGRVTVPERPGLGVVLR